MTGWFEGKGVLVTGGGSGIGAAAACRFAQEGAGVCIADINIAGAEAVAASIVNTGGRATAIKVDIASPDDNEAMVARTLDEYGRLDAAFLNAAYLPAVGGFEQTDIDTFDRTLAINLRGTFLGLKAVLAKIEKGGAAVVTSSSSGVLGFPMGPAYSISKHGVIGLVGSASLAFAEKGCRVNVICPGATTTPMAGAVVVAEGDGDDPQKIVDPADLPPVAFRGWLRPQHIAEVAVFLASSRAGGVNGTTYPVDGGYVSTMVIG